MRIKKMISTCCSALLVLSFVGCSAKQDAASRLVDELVRGQPNENHISTSESASNSTQNTVILGTIQHQPQGIDITSLKANDLILNYSGGEFSLPYQATVTGDMKDVGFFLFVDGVSVPYQIDSPDAPYEYCHSFHFSQEDIPNEFTFFFTPSLNADGLQHSLSVISITKPDFKPDMVETSGYGANSSSSNFDLLLQDTEQGGTASTTPNATIVPSTSLTSVTQQDTLLAGELLAKNWMNGGAFDPEQLETSVRQVFTFNDTETFDNYAVQENQPVAIQLYTCGVPGASYRTTFFLDNVPLCDTQMNSTFDITLQKGMANILEVTLDPESIGAGATFYAISIPMNASDFPDASVSQLNSLPVLLYPAQGGTQK